MLIGGYQKYFKLALLTKIINVIFIVFQHSCKECVSWFNWKNIVKINCPLRYSIDGRSVKTIMSNIVVIYGHIKVNFDTKIDKKFSLHKS